MQHKEEERGKEDEWSQSGERHIGNPLVIHTKNGKIWGNPRLVNRRRNVIVQEVDKVAIVITITIPPTHNKKPPCYMKNFKEK